VRRTPLGADRAHRRYWWGLGGERGCILAEEEGGRIGRLEHPEQLDAVLDALDGRGVREAGLQAQCEKVRQKTKHRAPPCSSHLPMQLS
jgi:hypothetical protein